MLGNLFPRVRESAPKPSRLSGESELAVLLLFWLPRARDGRQPTHSDTPFHPAPPRPRLLPLRRPDARLAGAAAVFPRPEPSAAGAPSQSVPQESAPGQGTRKPLQTRPLEGPGPRSRPRGGDPVGAESHSGLRAALRKAAGGPSVPARVPAVRAAPSSPTGAAGLSRLERSGSAQRRALVFSLGAGRGGGSGHALPNPLPAHKHTLTLRAWAVWALALQVRLSWDPGTREP